MNKHVPINAFIPALFAKLASLIALLLIFFVGFLSLVCAADETAASTGAADVKPRNGPMLIIGDSIVAPAVGNPPTNPGGGIYVYCAVSGLQLVVQSWIDAFSTQQETGDIEQDSLGRLRWKVAGDSTWGPWYNASKPSEAVGGWIEMYSGDGVSKLIVSVKGSRASVGNFTGKVVTYGGNQAWTCEPKTWVTWMAGRLGNRFSSYKQFAIAGAKTSDMLLFTPQALSYGPYSAAMFAGGINDAPTNAVVAQTSIDNAKAIIDLLSAAVPRVYVARRLPNLNPLWTTDMRDLTVSVEKAIREYCSTKKNVVYWDFYSELLSNTGAPETFASATDMSTDLLHPRIAGAAKIGFDGAAQVVMHDFPDEPTFVDLSAKWNSATKRGVINSNPTLRGSTGTIAESGGITSAIGVPDGWSIKRFGENQLLSCSWVAPVDGVGDPFWTMTVSNGDGKSYHSLELNTPITGLGISKDDILRFSLEVQIGETTGGGLYKFFPYVTTVGGTRAITLTPIRIVENNSSPYLLDMVGMKGRRILKLHGEMKLDTGAALPSRLSLRFQLGARDAGSTAEVGVRLMALEIVPTH